MSKILAARRLNKAVVDNIPKSAAEELAEFKTKIATENAEVAERKLSVARDGQWMMMMPVLGLMIGTFMFRK
jgi:hypothetical protein